MAKRQEDRKQFGSRSKSYGPRVVGSKQTRRRILIICEGTETETQYFNGFKARVRPLKLEVEGLGKAPTTLVEKARGIKARVEAVTDGVDAVWCVFDRDNFGVGFTRAMSEAKEEGFQVAYSNPCFELWFVLHFEHPDEPLDCAACEALIEKHQQKRYQKADSKRFNDLLPLCEKACERAEKLHARHKERGHASGGGLDIGASNPITNVHALVSELRRNLT